VGQRDPTFLAVGKMLKKFLVQKLECKMYVRKPPFFVMLGAKSEF